MESPVSVSSTSGRFDAGWGEGGTFGASVVNYSVGELYEIDGREVERRKFSFEDSPAEREWEALTVGGLATRRTV